MDREHTLPELVATAQSDAQTALNDIATLPQDDADTRITATLAIERIAVDLFSVFEARMQRHFKRGPLSRKLTALLVANGETDLADRLHQHYMAINVLKHGTGASYRELQGLKNPMFVLNPPRQGDAPATGLIDVTVPGFFDRLGATVLEAYHYMEKR